MANRRMFAKSITGSARFIRMPVNARLLYYDLGMHADDEGVVEAFPVMRMTGAADEDLGTLESKGFVIILNDDLVTYISDWKENNNIQKDRFKPSIYHELVERIHSVSKLDTNCIRNGSVSDTKRIQNGSSLETQVRLGKDRLDQVSIGEVVVEPPPPAETLESFADLSFRGLSPIAMQELITFKEDLPEDVIRWAICQSIDSKVRTWKYCKSILNRCLDMGLKTMKDVLQAEEEHAKKKQAKANPAAHGYQERDYGSDEDYGIKDLSDEERQQKLKEAEEMLRREHPEWY